MLLLLSRGLNVVDRASTSSAIIQYQHAVHCLVTHHWRHPDGGPPNRKVLPSELRQIDLERRLPDGAQPKKATTSAAGLPTRQSIQFSACKPGTCRKCRRLRVTCVASGARALAAISRSARPIFRRYCTGSRLVRANDFLETLPLRPSAGLAPATPVS